MPACEPAEDAAPFRLDCLGCGGRVGEAARELFVPDALLVKCRAEPVGEGVGGVTDGQQSRSSMRASAALA